MPKLARTVVVAALAVALGAGLVPAAQAAAPTPASDAPAAAAAKPTAGIRLVQSQRKKGEKVVVRYSTSRLPAGSKVELQRTFGTAAKFRKIATLRAGTAGTYTTKAPAMGRYQYRVVVKDARGKLVVRSKPAVLRSFQWISWSRLTGSRTDTVQIGDSLYRYAYHTYYNGDPHTAIELDRSSCKVAELTGVDTDPPGVTGELAIVQEARDTVRVALPQDSIRSLRGTLGLGTAVHVTTTTGDPYGTFADVYLNGRFLCFTADGER